jgi:predicted nucleotidyltransferase component of viral defense system
MTDFRLHEDQALFREAIEFTNSVTKFPQRLIEKDYYCSALLNYFSGVTELVFKGGTCLAKVHANFYRLSEDLDFVIPIAIESKKSERKKSINPVKETYNKINDDLPVFRIAEKLTGANQSTQYIGAIEYNSILSERVETIKVEVGLREPLLEVQESRDVRTILLNPVNNQRMIPEITFSCISGREAFAEKFRAALTRRDVAIRDFFDIDYAVNNLKLDVEDTELVELTRKKLAVPGNDPVDVGNDRFETLQRQLETELKPVLRTKDYNQFDLNRAFKIVEDMSDRLI